MQSWSYHLWNCEWFYCTVVTLCSLGASFWHDSLLPYLVVQLIEAHSNCKIWSLVSMYVIYQKCVIWSFSKETLIFTKKCTDNIAMVMYCTVAASDIFSMQYLIWYCLVVSHYATTLVCISLTLCSYCMSSHSSCLNESQHRASCISL